MFVVRTFRALECCASEKPHKRSRLMEKLICTFLVPVADFVTVHSRGYPSPILLAAQL